MTISFENYPIEAKFKSNLEGFLYSDSFTLKCSCNKGKYHGVCLDTMFKAVSKTDTNTKFSINFEKSTIDVTLDPICMWFIPS